MRFQAPGKPGRWRSPRLDILTSSSGQILAKFSFEAVEEVRNLPIVGPRVKSAGDLISAVVWSRTSRPVSVGKITPSKDG